MRGLGLTDPVLAPPLRHAWLSRRYTTPVHPDPFNRVSIQLITTFLEDRLIQAIGPGDVRPFKCNAPLSQKAVLRPMSILCHRTGANRACMHPLAPVTQPKLGRTQEYYSQ